MSLASQAAVDAKAGNLSRELKVFAVASLMMGMSYSMVDSVFNNFLNARFSLDPNQRSFLELPRELPGFLVVFISALLFFLCSRRLGVLAMGLGLAGSLLLGYFSPTYIFLVLWLFVYSLGQHLFMPAAAAIGMELAEEGKTGRRLGQLNAIRNFAAICGSAIIFVGFKYLAFDFKHAFTLAAVGFTCAAVLMFAMKPEKAGSAKTFLTLHKEYRLYYILALISGSRKQLFITFAPWVLVNVMGQPTERLAMLITIGGIIGILFQPALGRMIDHFGERVVLCAEAVLLVLVCFGYGFSNQLFSAGIAFFVVTGCYLLDNMLMSVSMARSTYMKKIALKPDDVQAALTAGVTIDHAFSITAALLGGLIWNAFGYQYVFLLGTVIAVLNFFFAMKIKIAPAYGTPITSGR